MFDGVRSFDNRPGDRMLREAFGNRSLVQYSLSVDARLRANRHDRRSTNG